MRKNANFNKRCQARNYIGVPYMYVPPTPQKPVFIGDTRSRCANQYHLPHLRCDTYIIIRSCNLGTMHDDDVFRVQIHGRATEELKKNAFFPSTKPTTTRFLHPAAPKKNGERGNPECMYV